MMKHADKHTSKHAFISLLFFLLVPLCLTGQAATDTIPWREVHLAGSPWKIMPLPGLPPPSVEAAKLFPEVGIFFGFGRKSASFGQLSEWSTDSLINWFYGQPEPLERLFTEMESEIGFGPDPIAYESSTSWQAGLAYSRWLGPSVRVGAGLSLGVSSLNGKVGMLAFPFYSETFEPQPLEGQLSGNMLRTGLFAEATWYASGGGRYASGGGRWRPLAGISSAWNHISWKDTQLQVAGINFVLPEPEAVNAFSGGVHAGGRWQSVQAPITLEARLFYKHLFTGYSTSVAGLSLSIIMRLV